LIATIRGLLVGAAGGALCWLAGIPAPWLAGSMIAGVAAIFAGVKVGMPDWLKAVAFIFLGIQTGTSVTWDTVDRAANWPLSILFLGLTVVAVTWACYRFYLRRGWDAPTALFASLPGALALVLLLAANSSADMRRVTIAQCIRLFFLVAALPAVINLISPDEGMYIPQHVMGNPVGIAILVVVATLAGLGLERLRFPAGLILGPTLVAAAFELWGVIDGALPPILLVPANVILGGMIAVRFTAFTFAEFRAALREGFSGFVIALAIAATGAAITAWVAKLPLALTLLAFSPGGLDAMTIMAFALNLDPAYVGAHQVARYLGMALLMPVVTTLILQRIAPRRKVTSPDFGGRLDPD
jgi:membrane AbrB-like protein